jgi:hypothetical protein
LDFCRYMLRRAELDGHGESKPPSLQAPFP